MGPLRYLLFAAVGAVVASVLFLAINFIVAANFEAGTSLVEGWIVRATCDRYELTGAVRDTGGRPVAYAVVEASYLDVRFATRSNSDGTFVLTAAEATCDRRLRANVSLLVMADDYRPKRQAVPFETQTLEITLDARDFRP